MAQQQPPIFHPVPRRAFELANDSEPSTPLPEAANTELLSAQESSKDGLGRTGSILNLTSPTLYGIYSPTAFDSPREESTPWGTEVQPSSTEKWQLPPVAEERPRRGSSRRTHGFRGAVLPLLLKSVLLFSFGVAYGTLVSHLHENHWITPVKTNIDSSSWLYLGLWGFAGVALGSVLPWLDVLWEDFMGPTVKPAKGPDAKSDGESRSSRWSPVVRSIGAFIGIAFATRRLPWQSTAQASLTLALANPVLWYIIDRSKPGFVLSTAVGLVGMGVILQVNPEMIPIPTDTSATIPMANRSGQNYGLELGLSQETIAIGTWIASVLFCACVCFGNIGRLLALGGRGGSR